MTLKKDITSALTVSFLTIAAGAAFGVWTGVGSSLGILSMVVASIMGVFFGGGIGKNIGPYWTHSRLNVYRDIDDYGRRL
jgi:MFS superfamily sulfate permease-like transporter